MSREVNRSIEKTNVLIDPVSILNTLYSYFYLYSTHCLSILNVLLLYTSYLSSL